MQKYLIQYAGVATHSVRRHSHEANIILTITGHELLFISLDFMVANLWVLRLHDQYTYQAVNTHTQVLVTLTARALTCQDR